MKRGIFYPDWEMLVTELLELCKLRNLTFYIIPFLLLSFSSAKAQEYPDKVVHHLMKDGINKIILQDYRGAELIFAKLNNNYPNLPLGNIYLAGVKIAKAADYGEPFDNDAIEDQFNKAEQKCNLLLKKDPSDIWNNCFYALTKSYKAYFQALKKEYIGAFSNGIISINYFEKCLKADSTFYECYLAIGTYKYWRSEKTEFLEWLPFINDERQAGINLLEKALRYPSYNYHLGVHSLIWIYLNNDQADKAITLAERALQQYPESRFFKWSLAAAYQRKDKRKAIAVFKDILSSIMRLPNNNHLNEIVLKHKIAMLYKDLGEHKKALEYCNDILGISRISQFTTDQLENRMERVRRLQRELSGS